MKKTIGRIFLFYIKIIAKLQLLKNRPIIVGITGSEGKTSTKKAVSLVLKEKYKVKETGKANSESGIPLDILGIEVTNYSLITWLMISFLAIWKLITNWERFDIYVVEMGIDSIRSPKNMGYLLSILEPDISIITSISTVHAMNFQDGLTDEEKSLTQSELEMSLMRLIAKEKGRIATDLVGDEKLTILNIDDKYISELTNDIVIPLKTISSNIEDNPDLLIKGINQVGKDYQVEYKNKNSNIKLTIREKIFGDEYAHTFGFAILVGQYFEIPFEEVEKSLNKYESEPGRFSTFKGIKESLILDSSYNATPNSMKYSLKKLHEVASGRRIAVLGEMREIGSSSEVAHEQMAVFAIDYADLFLLVGEDMKKYFQPKLTKESKWFANSRELGTYLSSIIQSNDTILFEGSQNKIFLEEAIKSILEDPEDESKLCRDSKWWKAEKEAFFRSQSESR